MPKALIFLCTGNSGKYVWLVKSGSSYYFCRYIIRPFNHQFLCELHHHILACAVDDVNTSWIGWSDPSNPSYDKHNLIFDVPHKNLKRQRSETIVRNASVGVGVVTSRRDTSPIFSIVKTWSRSLENTKLREEAGVEVE